MRELDHTIRLRLYVVEILGTVAIVGNLRGSRTANSKYKTTSRKHESAHCSIKRDSRHR
jgi:hypothetical protein